MQSVVNVGRRVRRVLGLRNAGRRRPGYGPTGDCSPRLAKTPVDMQQDCGKLPFPPVDRL